MAATAELSVSKAALTATLLRPDPTSLSHGAVGKFLQWLDETFDKCSRSNIEKCKSWIMANVVCSPGRAACLGKYLVALSESMDMDDKRPGSVRKRRLYVLYLASDVLHHAARRHGDFVRAWDAHLPAMVAAASTFERCPRHLGYVRRLIDLWERREYLSAEPIQRLRDTFHRYSDKNSGTPVALSAEAIELAKKSPYVLPPHHGDSSVPWYDLPAASWLSQLDPDSTAPLTKALLRPIQLKPGPASDAVAKLVEATLAEAEALYRTEPLRDMVSLDFNVMGERQKQSLSSDEMAHTRTYWAWTRRFCRHTKDRQEHAQKSLQARRTRSRSRTWFRRDSRSPFPRSPRRPKFSSRSPSHDRSRSRSHSPRRRRRHESGSYRVRSPSRRRNRSLDRRRSRSPSRRRRRDSSYSRSRSCSRSRSRSRARSRSRGYSYSPPPRRGRQDYTPFPPRDSPRRSHSRTRLLSPSATRSPSPYHGSGKQELQKPPYEHNHSFAEAPSSNPGGFTAPPPPPPPPPIGYQGVFPPPPPPPPPPQGWTPNISGFVPPSIMGANWGGGSIPPPPPPLPPVPRLSTYDDQYQQPSYSRGRVGGHGTGISRGYRGRVRSGNGREGYGYGPT